MEEADIQQQLMAIPWPGGFEGINHNDAHSTDVGTETDANLPIPEMILDRGGEIAPPTSRLIHTREARFEEGYDSDMEQGPFLDAILNEGIQDFEEEALGNVPQPIPTPNTPANETTASVHRDIPPAMLQTFTVNQLKFELKIRNVKVGGGKKKDDFRRLLKEALAEKRPVVLSIETNMLNDLKDNEKSSVGATFHKDAYWEEIHLDEDTVPLPQNQNFGIVVRPPTLDKEHVGHVDVLHNFSKFKCTVEEFEGTCKREQTYASGTIKMDATTRKPLMETVKRIRSSLNPKIKKKHRLTPDSKPRQFADIFLPMKSTTATIKGKKKELFLFELMARWSIQKAQLNLAATTNGPSQDWEPIDPLQNRKYIALYILHSLNPCPRVSWKFNSQKEDPVFGNDFVHRAFGAASSKAAQKFKLWKTYLSLQDPALLIPPKKESLNWKFELLLERMNYIGPHCWNLGENFSVDEMTMRFKGRHADKRRITYKKEGDGFQADALCNEGFTYQVYMRNDPAPRKYIRMGLSPLHSRVMSLFDSCKDKFHRCAMDNLYNSAAFCRAAYNHPMKVLCHGVARKGGRGIPDVVKQEEELNKEKMLQVRGTVKAAILQKDPDCPSLVASSVYDTKPVHYLSMVSKELKWITKEKGVFNPVSGEVEAMKFLRMNTIDNYNTTMGNVDEVDQLRTQYRIDRNFQNFKWWWSPMFWGIGVLLTNAYVMYHRVCDERGVDKKDGLSHVEFRKHIAMYWLNPQEYDAAFKQLKSPLVGRKRSKLTDDELSEVTYDSIGPQSLTSKSDQCTRLDDRTYNNGRFNSRLDHTLDHFPVERKSNNAECALHNWAANIRTESQVMLCRTCNVHLCLPCYR